MAADDGDPGDRDDRVDIPGILKRAEQAYSFGELLKSEVELTLALRGTPDDPVLQTALATIQRRIALVARVSGQDTIID